MLGLVYERDVVLLWRQGSLCGLSIDGHLYRPSARTLQGFVF